MRTLVAIPVYNEADHVQNVLEQVRVHAPNMLVLDDGSSDDTPEVLNTLHEEMGFDLIRHEANAGYGRAIREIFQRAHRDGYDWVITMDCDFQHEPERIPDFLSEIENTDLDIISGSRYLSADEQWAKDLPPGDRRAINLTLTKEINERLGFNLTDSFCGFKAHRVSAMQKLDLTDDGYAFPMQLWVQAAANKLKVGEIPVELIYNDPNRSFGGGLDDPQTRLNHYRCVLYRAMDRVRDRLPDRALCSLQADC
ncbi:MAG: dolichyl-phosphate mannose synthase [Phycisphaerae bacterium]|nr:dolichyl-phosphate mannose synthase [Phycisphaerae bacterium]MBM90723.1 dolichyl-phosphate mannose synthase [Phycisphaerae bacterium]HCT46165.1 glycosyltransferase family 2 protein [Phycisphaerales bacterium]